ncbi:MAG: MFS transporter [Methanobacteriota archaeon]|nr:MAG: MFS transporter [Euryarchaeota archaeon]
MKHETREEQQPTTSQAETRAASHARLILAVVISAAFLDVVDFSVVQVALPSIQREFHESLASAQWIIGVYGLTLAGFLMVSGRAGDVYGQKRIFVVGIIGFALSSLTAGFAPSLLILIVSRGIQGVAAAMTTATALAILAATFPEGEERNKAFGVLVAVLSAGFAAGSILGGVLTAAFGWRSVMFVNVPIGALAAFLANRFISVKDGRAAGTRLDIPGAVTVTSGLVLLVYALTNAATVGFVKLETAAPLVLSVGVLAMFVAIERRSTSPLMPLSFVRRRTVFEANLLSILMTASAGGFLLLTVYLQGMLGYSPLTTGLAFLPPAAIFFFVGGWGASRLVNRLGMKKVLMISAGLVTLGSLLLVPISLEAGYFGILPGSVLWALGASIGFPALAMAGLEGTKPGEEGLASGLIQTSQRLGFPLGLAVLLTVASAFDPLLGLTGFRYAFIGATVLGAVALGLAILLGRVRVPDGVDEGASPGLEPVSDD